MMKSQKTIIIGALAIVVIIIASTMVYSETLGFGQSPTAGISPVSTVELILQNTQHVPEIRFDIPETAFPKELMVYTIDRNITEQEVLTLANNLGIQGEIIKEPGIIVIRQDSIMFDANLSSGVVFYIKTEIPGNTLEDIRKYMPSDEEARKIADNFLASHDLMPEGAKFYSVTHNEGAFGSDPQMYITSKSVWYSHEIDGYRILTDKLYVEIRDNGAVTRMFRRWYGYEPLKYYTIIGPDVAIASLNKTGIIIPAGMNSPEKAVVNEISIGYIGSTQTKDLPYLIPVYVFKGEVYGDGTSSDFYQWIPAIPELTQELLT